MVQGSLDIIHRGVWHAASIEDLQPFLGGLLLGCCLNQIVNLLPVLYSITVCGEARICLPLGVSQFITQHTKQFVVPASEKNVSVKSLVASVGHNRCFSYLSESSNSQGLLESTYDARCPIVPNPSSH